MKRDNNLFHVIWMGKDYWFTKINYIVRMTGYQYLQIDRIFKDPDYAESKKIKITVEDGSNIEYKYINVF